MLGLLLITTACVRRPGRVPVATVPARPEDVGTLDGLMKAFYEVVNLEPEAPRQWSRDRTLYIPDIRFVSIGQAQGRPQVDVWDHQALVDATEPMVQTGFHETEIHRVTRGYGNIVHIFSTYETQRGLDRAKRDRGVNSLQLYFDGSRWWVASVTWQSEDAAHPIPQDLLP